jgi:hypothetical protein
MAKESGKVFRFGKYFTSAMTRLDARVASKLWETSERLVQLK